MGFPPLWGESTRELGYWFVCVCVYVFSVFSVIARVSHQPAHLVVEVTVNNTGR